MIVVTLSPQMLIAAAMTGVWRHILAVISECPDRPGTPEDKGWQIHIEGSCGEVAAAIALGKAWEPRVNTYKSKADLGKNVEVRTRAKHFYDLLIRPDDDANKYYVLVTGQAPTYHVHGWIHGKDAMNPDWLKPHGNREEAYFVPQDSLHHFNPADE